MGKESINIEHLQNIAMLDLDEKDKIKFMTDMGYLLKLADEIKQSDLSNIPDDINFSFQNNIFREDVSDSDSNIKLTGHIVVPKIMD